VRRVEKLPGEEVQIDFGNGPPVVGTDGIKHKAWVFRIVLSYSRKVLPRIGISSGYGEFHPGVGKQFPLFLRRGADVRAGQSESGSHQAVFLRS